MSVTIGTVTLDHSVMNASGTYDPLTALRAGLPIHESLAAIVTKTITPLPRAGNPPRRIAEVAGGMINSIGLPGPGIDRFLAETLPAVRELGRPIVVSVGGFALADYVQLCRVLDSADGVVALELNISCPNVESGCVSIGSNTVETETVVAACRAVTTLPLWVKLSPLVADIAAIGSSAERGGADALVLVNTLKGLVLDRRTGDPFLGGGTGGLSGRLLKPVALAAVAACRSVVAVPLIGVGGITALEDARDFSDAGTVAIQIGSGAFANPGLAAALRAGF